MTARAGDALSHVNFEPSPGPIFKRFLQRARAHESAARPACDWSRHELAHWFRLYLHGHHEPSGRLESEPPAFTCADFAGAQ